MAYNDPNQPGYAPGGQDPSSYRVQPPGGQGGEPMHPAIPMLVSLFFPGGGLFFVPDKAGLAVVALLCWIGYLVAAFLLSFVVVGICFFLFLPVIHILAAVHSYDCSAKASNGRFNPVLFK